MNCLAYALRFWETHPIYLLYYNSDHVINIPKGTQISDFLPIEEYGYKYFNSAFEGLLDNHEKELLKRYFKITEGVV